jgi:hypothetical protein
MSFNRHLIGSLVAAAVLAPSLASADAPAAKWYDKLSVSGDAEGYYSMWLNQPGASDWNAKGGTYTDPQTVIPYRVFDANPNAFSYNAELILKYTDDASKTGATIDVIYGTKANAINSGQLNYNNSWWAPNDSPYAFESNFVVGQAFLNQSFGPVTATLGKFATPIGYESWNTTANANYSRGLLYSQEPFYSLGAKVDYAAPMAITASLWVDNGNSVDSTYGDAKNWGLELAYAGIKNLSVNAIYYRDVVGTATNGTFSPTDYYDFTASYTASDSLSFGAEYLHKEFFPYTAGTQTSSVSQGYALYSTYVIKNLNISPRFEQYFIPDGAGTNGASATPTYELSDYTLTLKYPMGPVSHILEYRVDASNAAEFYTNSDNSGKGTQLDQTLTYAAVYAF